MNDLFRAIFGIKNDNQPGERMGDRIPQYYRRDFSENSEYNRGNSGYGNNDDDDDDDDDDDSRNMRGQMGGGFFGFPMFNDAADIHKHLDTLINNMNRAFGMFGFSGGPGIPWEDESNGSSFFREEQPRTECLRNAYLKQPDCACNRVSQNDNFSVDLNLREGDFQQEPSNTVIQYSHPKVYSKSVFIQTIRRPDGSVETIKKVTDHEGNEETTVSQTNVNDPPLPPSPPQAPLKPKDDTSGVSIFKKFFSF